MVDIPFTSKYHNARTSFEEEVERGRRGAEEEAHAPRSTLEEASNARADLAIELHSHYRDMRRVTDYVTAVSWSHAVEPPWGGIQLSLKIPRAVWADLLPRTGEWIVVRLGGIAEAFGYVTQRNCGLVVQGSGAVATTPVSVMAIPWLSVLGKMALAITPGSETRIGTLMDLPFWQEAMTALYMTAEGMQSSFGKDESGFREARSLVRQDVGTALRELWPTVAQLVMPSSLGGELLGEGAQVVHDDATRKAFAPTRVVESVPGWGFTGLHAAMPSSTSVLALIMGTFGADQGLVEIFPGLESPGVPANAPPLLVPFIEKYRDGALVDTPSAFGKEDLSDLRVNAERRRQVAWASQQSRANGIDMPSKLASALGRVPVLLYRMRPWRNKPLSAQVASETAWLSERGLEGLANASIAGDLIDPTLFEAVTWRPDDAPQIPVERVVAVHLTGSDDDAANVVTVGLPMAPDAPSKFWASMRLPIVQGSSPSSADPVMARGARLYSPPWPFFHPPDSRYDSLELSMRTIAVQAAQWSMGGDRFERGSARLAFTRSGSNGVLLRHGQPVRLGMPGGAPGEELTAYVDSVTHTFSVGNRGAVTATTDVQFSRGLFDESRRSDASPHAQGIGAVTSTPAPLRGL